jgi:hypothetical protein
MHVHMPVSAESHRDACATPCLEKHVVFLVNVVNQWVIVVNQRFLVVSLWCLSRARPDWRDAVVVQIGSEPVNCAPRPWLASG